MSYPNLPTVDLSDGLCVSHPNPDLWHDDNKAGQHEAKRLCDTCPALAACATLALSDAAASRDKAYGVWAGMGPRERMRIHRFSIGEPAPDPLEGTEAAKMVTTGYGNDLASHMTYGQVAC